MAEGAPRVGLLTVELHLPAAHSLKDKRSVVVGLLERLAHRHNVAVAEVAALDQHQTAVLALVTVANDGAHVERVAEACLRFIETEDRAEILYSNLEFL